jgi:hypothetical protein
MSTNFYYLIFSDNIIISISIIKVHYYNATRLIVVDDRNKKGGKTILRAKRYGKLVDFPLRKKKAGTF